MINSGCVIIYLGLFSFCDREERGGGGEGEREDGGRRDVEARGEGQEEAFSPTNSPTIQYKDRREKRRLKESVTTE